VTVPPGGVNDRVEGEKRRRGNNGMAWGMVTGMSMFWQKRGATGSGTNP